MGAHAENQVNDCALNEKLMRYAEVLLMYVKAQNEAAGPDASVYDAVNQVRNRVSMPGLPAGLTKEEMRERIRHERRIEFGFEAKRYFEVLRWGIGEEIIIKKRLDPKEPLSLEAYPNNSNYEL